MLKKLLSLTLSVLLLHAVNATPVLAFAQASQRERRVEKVKANVAKRAGKKSRVTVKLQDGSKLKGSITQAGEDSFTLTDSKTGQTSTLAYQDVTEVKGQGLSLTAKILIVAGIALVVLVIVVAVGITSTGLGSGPIIGGL
jgi:Flp pilus assembly protein TadB